MERNARDDLQGLIFATLNLRYLRGLTIVPFGIWMALFPLLGHMTRWSQLGAGAGLRIATVLAVISTRRLNRHYDERYGRVEANHRRGFPGAGFGVWGAVFIVLTVQGVHGVPAVALWLAALFFGIYMSSSGYRWYYLVLAAVFAGLTPWWVGIGDWQAPLLGLAFALAGVMDHLLLRRLLPVHGESEAAPSVA